MLVDVRGGGRFETLHYQPLKALGHDGGESYGSVVVKVADVALLGHWNDGCCFEAGLNSCFGHRHIEDVCKDDCKLLGTFSELFSLNCIRSFRLPGIHRPKDVSHFICCYGCVVRAIREGMQLSTFEPSCFKAVIEMVVGV